MLKQEEREAWREIKEIWGKSSQGEKISFQFSKLINELNNSMSQWEKDAVKSDLIKVKKSWDKYKGNVSQWEKDAVSKDLTRISKLFKIFLKKLKRKN